MAILHHDGFDIFYTDQGTGFPALLIHGWCCDSHDWSWQIPLLLELGYRVIAADLRGHGRSGIPDGGYDPKTFASDSAALLDSLSVKSALVLSHSMGSVIASELEIQRPDLVAGQVLVDSSYVIENESIDAFFTLSGNELQTTTIAIFNSFCPPEVPEWLKVWHERRVMGMPDHVIVGCSRGLFGPGSLGVPAVAREYFKKRSAPRLAIYLSDKNAEFEKSFGVGSMDEIHVFTEGGHFLHKVCSEKFNAILRDWLLKVKINE